MQEVADDSASRHTVPDGPNRPSAGADHPPTTHPRCSAAAATRSDSRWVGGSIPIPGSAMRQKGVLGAPLRFTSIEVSVCELRTVATSSGESLLLNSRVIAG
jgi:hypothetical protein